MSFDRAKLFATQSATEKMIAACGMEFPVFVRRLPALDLRQYNAELMSPEIKTRTRAGFEALHKAIRNADGSTFASPDEYSRMDADAIKALTDAFMEVNASGRAGGDEGNG